MDGDLKDYSYMLFEGLIIDMKRTKNSLSNKRYNKVLINHLTCDITYNPRRLCSNSTVLPLGPQSMIAY